jgi:hypothetical protein
MRFVVLIRMLFLLLFLNCLLQNGTRYNTAAPLLFIEVTGQNNSKVHWLISQDSNGVETIYRYIFYACVLSVYIMIMFAGLRDFHLNHTDIYRIVIFGLVLFLCEWAVTKYIKKRRH